MFDTPTIFNLRGIFENVLWGILMKYNTVAYIIGLNGYLVVFNFYFACQIVWVVFNVFVLVNIFNSICYRDNKCICTVCSNNVM